MIEGFLELTKHNRDDILAYVGGASRLRGARVKVLRGKGDKTSLRFMALRSWAAEYPDMEMAAEKDPQETLRALFEFRRTKRDERGVQS